MSRLEASSKQNPLQWFKKCVLVETLGSPSCSAVCTQWWFYLVNLQVAEWVGGTVLDHVVRSTLPLFGSSIISLAVSMTTDNVNSCTYPKAHSVHVLLIYVYIWCDVCGPLNLVNRCHIRMYEPFVRQTHILSLLGCLNKTWTSCLGMQDCKTKRNIRFPLRSHFMLTPSCKRCTEKLF